jgi:hypothetical protein
MWRCARFRVRALEGGQRLFSAVMAKDELIDVNLKLTSADAVMGPDETVLQIANSASAC